MDLLLAMLEDQATQAVTVLLLIFGALFGLVFLIALGTLIVRRIRSALSDRAYSSDPMSFWDA